MVTRASFRLVRTGLVGSIVVALAAGGHLAGGGTLPGPMILAALCALALIPVAALTRRRLTFPVLAGLLGLGQVWLHFAFDALGSHSLQSDTSLVSAGHAGHWAGALAPAIPAGGPTAETLCREVVMAAGWPMLAAHVATTLVTALLLARGEEALWLLAAWLRPLIRLARPFIVPVGVRPAWPEAGATVLPAAPGLRLPVRRGPPQVFAAV